MNIDELEEFKRDPDVIKRYLEHLSKTVARDEVVKKAVLLTGISAYTDDPINLFLRGPASIGKTHNVREGLKYFPDSDVLFLGGMSPTALIHEHGVLIDENGEPINTSLKPNKIDFMKGGTFDREGYRMALRVWEEKIANSRVLVDLQNKILVFLEAPHLETFMRLRPLLSHDKWEISYKFTDKTSRGSLRTQHVVLRGWPAAIFCSTDVKYIEDLATRGFTITPEMTMEKYKEAIYKQAAFESSPFARMERESGLQLLKGYISVIATHAKLIVSRSFPIIVPYASCLASKYPVELSRDMRDFSRLLALIKAATVFRIFNAPQLVLEKDDGTLFGRYWIATEREALLALDVFRHLEETTKTGLPKNILDFYYEVIANLTEPATISELMDRYNEGKKKPVSSRTIRRWCTQLAEVGLIDVSPDPEKRSRLLVTPLKSQEKTKETGNFGNLSNCRFFTLDFLKEWFIGLQKTGHEIGLRVYIKLSSGAIIKSPEEIVYYANEFFVQNHLGDSQVSFDKRDEKIRQLEKLPGTPGFFGERSAKNEEKICGVERLDRPLEGYCDFCCQDRQEKKVLFWKAETFKGEILLLCETCAQNIIKIIRGGLTE